MKKKKEEIAVIEQPKNEIILEGNPEAQLEYASTAAKALMRVAKPINIQGKQYLPYGSWQVLGRFFGSTAGVEWTKKIEEGGKLLGYEARAVVYRNGIIISSAEASCMKTERNWSNRDEYAIKSMAQTRACAKALRNGFGWVAEMGGYSATPAEEMDGVEHEPMKPYTIPRNTPAADDEAQGTREDKAAHDEVEDMQREGIKEQMKLLKKPLTKKAVMELTGLEYIPANFDGIYKKLRAEVEKADPLTTAFTE